MAYASLGEPVRACSWRRPGRRWLWHIKLNRSHALQVNTGLPALKICLEAIVGTLGGGVAVWAVTYTAYGINGGSHANTVTKAAMTLLFGSLMLMLGTASRFRWPQHVGLAGIFFNLTVAVGCAVCYKVTHE